MACDALHRTLAGAHGLVLALVLPSPGWAWWPFGDSKDRQQQHHGHPHAQVIQLPPGLPPFMFGPDGMPPGLPPGMPPFMMGGHPVMVVERHFGFDPWEDLHSNVKRVVQVHQSAMPGPGGVPGNAVALPGGAMGMPPPLEMQLKQMMSVFGNQHAGHFGRAEGSFQVDDDHHSRFRITASLPGYKLGEGLAPDQSPLSVRAVGRRSLVVSGKQQMGPMVKHWQRSFELPKGCDLEHVNITYSAANGNLTVDVPRRNVTGAEAVDSDEDEEEDIFQDPFAPPALQVMHRGMPQIVHIAGQGPPRPGGGFLVPAGQMPDIMGQMMGVVGGMHPRFHPPEGGEQPVPEDAVVNLVGCFAESQLDKVELKYYGNQNAASFNAMYWHATADHVQYFAMARHGSPLGHAFTAHGFVHDHETPQYGVYDGCGTRCEDDDSRWCGCANEASRQLMNPDCSEEGGKRFAVYKIGTAQLPEKEDDAVSGTGEKANGQTEPVQSQGRPYWQLHGDDSGDGDSSGPSIDIVVPKGTVAETNGKEVLLYNASVSPSGVAGVASTTPEVEVHHESAAMMSGHQATTVAPVGKVKLPVGVNPSDCDLDASRTSEDGGQVLKCKLKKEEVKRFHIKVVDEL